MGTIIITILILGFLYFLLDSYIYRKAAEKNRDAFLNLLKSYTKLLEEKRQLLEKLENLK